jgi:hypothetical protein
LAGALVYNLSGLRATTSLHGSFTAFTISLSMDAIDERMLQAAVRVVEATAYPRVQGEAARVVAAGLLRHAESARRTALPWSSCLVHDHEAGAWGGESDAPPYGY